MIRRLWVLAGIGLGLVVLSSASPVLAERTSAAARPARRAAERLTPQAVSARAFAEGRRRELAGDLRGAFLEYSRAVEAHSENAEAQIAYGRMIEPQNAPLAFFHYQVALRTLIDQAGDSRTPILPRFRRFLVDKYVSYALPVAEPAVSIRLLQQALVLEPQDPRIHAQLSLAHFVNKDYERSIGEGRLAWSLGLEDAQLRVNVGLAFLQAGETNAAANELTSALEADQFDVLPVLASIKTPANVADLEYVPYERGLGRRRYEEIVGGSTMGRIGEALRLRVEGDTAGALRKIREAVSARPNHVHVRVYEGDLLRSMGDLAGSDASYQAGLASDTRNFLIRMRLGDLAVESGRYADAARYYNEVLSRPDVSQAGLAEVVANAAKAYAASGDATRGVRVIDEWLNRYSPARNGAGGMEPREAFLLRVEKARILAGAGVGRAEAAEAAYRDVARSHPLEGEAYVAAANHFRSVGKAAAARSLINDGIVRLESAREAAPQDPKSYIELAALKAATEDTPAAVQILQDGAARTSVPREFVNALYRIREYAAAEAAARTWRTRATNRAEAVEATLFWAFLAAESNRNTVDARQAIEAFADGAVPEVALRRVRGYLEFRLGHWREALRDIEFTLEQRLGAERPLYQRLAGLSYAELGDPFSKRKALEHLEAAFAGDSGRNADLAERIQTLRGE